MQLFRTPLFVVGNPRSGTSLLRLILTSHREILIPPECGFIVWLQAKYGDWSQSDCMDPVRTLNFLEDLFAAKKFDTWKLERKAVRESIKNRLPRNYSELCEVIYAAYGISIGRNFSIWGDKNNFYINYLEELLRLYGNAHFLHIIRDGRDVACSYREVMAMQSKSLYAPKLSIDMAEIAREWAENVMKADLFMDSIPRNQSMTIAYESLVMRPLETVEIVCQWLNLKFEPEMLNFYQVNQKNKLEPELLMDWKARTCQPIGSQTVGRYKTLLSGDELAIFEAVADSVLKKFQYT